MTGHLIAGDRRRGGYIPVALATMLVASLFVIAPPAQALPAAGTVDFEAATSDAGEENTPHTLNVVLDVGPGNTLDAGFTVSVAVVGASPGTATGGGTDYTYTSASVTFDTDDPDGATRPIDIAIVNDLFDEADETIELELTNLVNTTGASSIGLVQPTHTVFIRDNDPTPTVTIGDALTVTEGSVASFPVMLSGQSAAPVTVTYSTTDVTTTAGSDYTVPSGSLVIPPLTSSGSIDVTTLTDGSTELQESFTVTLQGATNGTLGSPTTGTGRIDDDGLAVPSVSIADALVVEEGGVASFPVALSAQTAQQVTVTYTLSNVTTTAGDYTAPSGTLIIPPFNAGGAISVATTNDVLDEADSEAFTITLSGATNANLGSPTTGTGRIDDDGLAVPSVSIADAPPVTEGGPPASFPVTLSAPTAQQVTVTYTLSNVTTTGGDYTAPSGTLIIPPLSAGGAISVTITDDPLDEADSEAFTITLGGANNANLGSPLTGTGTINDNDPLPTISIGSASVLEGGAVSFPVTLSAVSGRAISVNYATSSPPGTATAGTDYTVTTGTLTIPANTLPGPISVPTATDLIDEGAGETFTLQLSTPSNVTITGGTATGTITDDDIATFAISDAAEQVEEGAAASFTVSLSTPSSSAVSVDYRTADATAVAPDDYTAIGLTTLIFAPGETTKPVTVATIDDTIDEANETFAVNLLNSSGPAIADASGIGTILDGDGPPGLSVLDAAVVSEGPGTVELKFTVALLPMSGQIVTADYATANGTAVAPGDYVSKFGTVTFDPGETLKDVLVAVTNDALDEIDETVLLNLTGWTNTGIPADAQATGTIMDDDNVDPTVSIRITDQAGAPGIEFETGEIVRLEVTVADPGAADSHDIRLYWGDGTPVESFGVTPAGRTFQRTHVYAAVGFETISVVVADEDGGSGSRDAFVNIVPSTGVGGGAHRTGLVDPSQGKWYLYNDAGSLVTQFYYGNPGDYPFMGDWDGDGIETPGLYRQSDGYVYLRNSNTVGIADIKFYFGNPGDVPIAGDFNGDGFDTVSIYRPSNQRFYIINKLGSNDGGLGAADVFYTFGNPGDKPFVGDFDGDGVETAGLHRESTGLVYFRNTHTHGNADSQFLFGDPADRLVAGDWTGDGVFTPTLFRPSNTTVYFRYTNTQGIADNQFVPAPTNGTWLPVSGVTGF